MGKNVFGGNKSKKFARKQVGGGSGKLRLAEDEYEKYGVVIRISGGAICRVKILGVDTELICHIRGKFRGRNKMGNLISGGTVVLIGLREDLSTKEECDLLYVYESAEVESLAKYPEIKISRVIQLYQQSNNTDYLTHRIDDGFIFTNEEMPIMTETPSIGVISETVDMIDVDDI